MIGVVTMKTLMTLTAALGFMLSISSQVMADSTPVPEPDLSTQIGWGLTHSGMLFVSYDLDQNGKPDYFTLRVVKTSFSSKDSLKETAHNHPLHIVFTVPYRTSCYYYISEMKPLFYAYDFDEDGHWDIMYKDVLTDGVNGNEEFYDSPSKKRPLNVS
jgi:hypothetical protein